jgi:hypothetical protein
MPCLICLEENKDLFIKIANLFFITLDRDEMVIKPISRFCPFNDKNLTLETWLFFGCLLLRQGSDDVWSRTGGTEKELAYNFLRLCPPAGNKQHKIKIIKFKIQVGNKTSGPWHIFYFLFCDAQRKKTYAYAILTYVKLENL